MTLEGFKKAFDQDNFLMVKTTGCLEVWHNRVKEVIEIDDANMLFIYRDVNGKIFVIDINDICAVMLKEEAPLGSDPVVTYSNEELTFSGGTISYDPETENLNIGGANIN